MENFKMSGHNLLRDKFLKFFESKGHIIFKSYPLIPAGDPTLLFTSAGMVPFKDYFTGKKIGLKRVATSQRCLRTADIDSVGKTPFHHTYFEMLGNFSFGDYFKKEAILWAWEFLTEKLLLEKDRLYISVYREDDESYQVWSKMIGIPKERIYRLDENTNFWPANAPKLGPNGPCGPCSEIYYDRGEKFCPKIKNCELVICEGTQTLKCYRCVEIWNLVFTQYNRTDTGLELLLTKNIDTGMGLERLLCVYENVESNFETSMFKNASDFVQNELGSEHKVAKRRILDHSRAVCFAIAEGIIPSNIGRGYVIRKLARKMMIESYFAKNSYTPYIYKLASIYANEYETVYPHLKENLEKVELYLKNEEEKFASKIDEFVRAVDSVLENKEAVIDSYDIFKLYDTYGVPIELVRELARSKGKSIDESGFYKLLEEQKNRSRSKSKLITDVFVTEGASSSVILTGAVNFVGYEKSRIESIVKAIIVDKEPVESFDTIGKEFNVIIDPTPFYGEEGGQVGDTGKIVSDYAEVEVIDTKKDDDLIYCICKLIKGKLFLYDKVVASIDISKRFNTARNHTGTHMLHAALRNILGNHVYQFGSLVAPTKLRFDFSHPKKLSTGEIEIIESFVNKKILENYLVVVEEKELEEAKKEGAIAFFGDKYKDRVRVVSIGDFSKELCGGTHLTQTGLVGFIKIIDESSIASGIRRIEAITGEQAIKMAQNDIKIVKKISTILEVPYDQVVEKLEKLLTLTNEMKKELTKYRIKEVLNNWNNILSCRENIKSVNGLSFSVLECNELNKELLNESFTLLNKFKMDILIVVSKEKPFRVALLLNRNLKGQYSADKILKEFLTRFGGSGGGSQFLAQGVLKNIEITQFQNKFINFLSEQFK